MRCVLLLKLLSVRHPRVEQRLDEQRLLDKHWVGRDDVAAQLLRRCAEQLYLLELRCVSTHSTRFFSDAQQRPAATAVAAAARRRRKHVARRNARPRFLPACR
jgi:hypothetical protein